MVLFDIPACQQRAQGIKIFLIFYLRSLQMGIKGIGSRSAVMMDSRLLFIQTQIILAFSLVNEPYVIITVR